MLENFKKLQYYPSHSVSTSGSGDPVCGVTKNLSVAPGPVFCYVDGWRDCVYEQDVLRCSWLCLASALWGRRWQAPSYLELKDPWLLWYVKDTVWAEEVEEVPPPDRVVRSMERFFFAVFVVMCFLAILGVGLVGFVVKKVVGIWV